MGKSLKYIASSTALAILAVILLSLVSLLFSSLAFAQSPDDGFNVIPPPDPKAGSFGIEATKVQDPPAQAATISVPANGAAFTTSPITVSGICQTGLLVQIYNNGVMVGAVMCEGGSFSLEVSLFAGSNELSAMVYDDLGQPGPISNIATVQYNDTNLQAFGELVTLTSNYGRRSAPAGGQLVWPLQLAGGSGPYAFMIDWGDGTDTQLLSQSLAGLVNIAHNYKQAGIYQVNIRVVDANEVSAFLQLIAVSSGQVDPNAQKEEEEGPVGTRVEVLWIPAAIALTLLLPTFWLGRRSQVVSLRNKMLKERDNYIDK